MKLKKLIWILNCLMVIILATLMFTNWRRQSIASVQLELKRVENAIHKFENENGRLPASLDELGDKKLTTASGYSIKYWHDETNISLKVELSPEVIHERQASEKSYWISEFPRK